MALRITLVALLAFVLAACQSSTLVRQEGFEIAKQGIAVTDAADGALRSIASVQRRDAEFQLFDNAVNAHLQAKISYSYQGLDAPQKPQILATRLGMLSEVRGAYEQLLALSDPALATEGAEAASGVLDAIGTIKALPEIPTGAQKAITAAAAAAITYAQASDIKELSKAYLALATALRDLWKEEAKVWTENYIDEVYRGHAKKIAQYKDDRFDPKSVAGIVKNPFVPAVRYRHYRGQLIAETHQEWKSARQKFGAVSSALDKLVDAHAELASSEASAADIVQILRDIRSVLEPLKGE